MSEPNKPLKFVPYESCIDPTFWHKFTKLKLDVDMLKESDRLIWGYYSSINNHYLYIDCTSFNKDFDLATNCSKANGYHLNLNTWESFKSYDKVSLLKKCGEDLEHKIKSDEAIDCPSLLSTFVLITFADLKKYHFHYWFAFPAPAKPSIYLTTPVCNLTSLITEDQVASLFDKHKTLSIDQQGFFGLSIADSGIYVHTLKDFVNILTKGFIGSTYYWGCVDPCESKEFPGWPLRNLLYLIYMKCQHLRKDVISVVCLRKRTNSIVLKVVFDENEVVEHKWTGWEANERGKLGPRFVDLSSSMDPIKLAEESVGLNLRLMKWRLAPDLDLAVVKATRCLLLGAGTLGCSVARSLLAWGVETITLVDSGNISYSNPVRQSLFTFDDCQKETSKAFAAASALQKIYPSVKSKGIKMTISMPGRGVNDIASVSDLEALVTDHDVVFLLTDTRESRWLPTLLAIKHGKIAITAALGFDTYLVLRHGTSGSTPRLGCYFCNDVTAPGNSVLDRTLDQQCTVTRPGVSLIAAALAVEVMVSLLQHPSRGALDTRTATCLGEVPHSIRGFLSSHTQILPSTPAFSQCTACSCKVVEEYNSRGMDFLKNVFQEAKYLEDLTGLTELHKATDTADILEFSDDEDM